MKMMLMMMTKLMMMKLMRTKLMMKLVMMKLMIMKPMMMKLTMKLMMLLRPPSAQPHLTALLCILLSVHSHLHLGEAQLHPALWVLPSDTRVTSVNLTSTLGRLIYTLQYMGFILRYQGDISQPHLHLEEADLHPALCGDYPQTPG